MGLSLTVDLDRPMVVVRQGRRAAATITSAKWLEFYCRLALGRMRGESWVTAATLLELDGWKLNKPHSVGKTVARHIGSNPVWRACLDTDKKTARWRLHPDTALEVVEGELYLAEWLRDRGMAKPRFDIALPWLTHMVWAQMKFHRGEISEATSYSRLALDAATEDRCLRVSAVQLIRAQAASGALDRSRDQVERVLAHRRGVTVPEPEALWGSDSLGLHCRARLAAMDALRSNPQEAPQHVASLRRGLQSADSGADLSRQTVLHNTLGVLTRRQGRYSDARFHLGEALVLALIVNDFFTLGGALFNLALTALVEPRPPNDDRQLTFAEALLGLCAVLDQQVQVGRSSAQAEILLARLHTGRGRLEKADALIDDAQRMVIAIGSAYDKGCLALARAELTWAKVVRGAISVGRGRQQARTLLLEAHEQFEKTESDAWHYVDDQLKRLDTTGALLVPWSTV